LPENTVQAFAQTGDHYLWIGTTGGLVRFNGASFVIFDRDNTPAIQENSIFCLATTLDGSLWAGTEGGGLIRYRDGAFRAYSAPEGLTNGFVRAVHEDRHGVLWAGTDDGLFRLVNGRFVRADGRGGTPELAVHAIQEDRAGRLWIGGSRLVTIQGGAVREFPLEGNRSAARVKSILETSDGAIWVGPVSGLERLAPGPEGKGHFTRVREVSSTVRALWSDRSGALLIGTIGAGLIRYRNGQFTPATGADSLPSSTILALFEDREQNLWAGMQTGLMRLSRTTMSTFPLVGAANADFGTVYPDRDGSLWVASTHLFRINPQRSGAERQRDLAPGIRVRNVFRDRNGTLWTGTEGYGVFRFEGAGRVQYTKRNGLVNDFVRVMLEGRDGSVWIGTDEGISRWLNGGFTNYGMADGLCYFSIRALLEDGRGDVWAGTDHGLSHWRGGAFIEDAITRRLRSEKVWTILEDREGGLWFGTRGGGLYRWRAGVVNAFGRAQGLTNSVYQLLEDAGGIFWMSGPNGISSVSRHDLDMAAADPTIRPAVTLYGLSDSVEATLMHGGVQPAACLTASGEIWFPSNRGPVRILPNQTRPDDVPQAVIERVSIDGREERSSGRLTVPPGRGKLQIDYSAIRLRSQERIGFRYKLEGFDADWSDAFQRRVAYYTNLPAGDYRFRVQAFEMNMPQNATEASLGMEWEPHIYRSGWFLALCAVLAFMIVFLAYRLRLRQVQARFDAVLEERNRMAREMHDTVIQGCTSVSAVLEAVASLGTEQSESQRSLLDCARQQVRATIDEARNAVWNLRQNGSAAPEIGLLLSQMVRQVSKASQVKVLFDALGETQTLDRTVQHDVLMVAREAVHNAVRHAQANEVRVRMQFEPGAMHIQVSDNGCGFEPDAVFSAPGPHFGLVGMRERIERLGGRFAVKSAHGRGTELSVDLPVTPTAPAKFGLN
jgi:signal transduction histidine kinase/ligand-binding sensor domain-containing protein